MDVLLPNGTMMERRQCGVGTRLYISERLSSLIQQDGLARLALVVPVTQLRERLLILNSNAK